MCKCEERGERILDQVVKLVAAIMHQVLTIFDRWFSPPFIGINKLTILW